MGRAQGDFNQDILAQFQAWAGVKLPFNPAASGVTLSPSQVQADAEYISTAPCPGRLRRLRTITSACSPSGSTGGGWRWPVRQRHRHEHRQEPHDVGEEAVFFPGGSGGIAAQRRQGVDGKAIAAVPGLADQTAISVDSITIESDRDCSSPLSGWAGAVSLAARAPGVRAGDILNAAGGLSSDTNGVNAGGASGHSKCYPTLQGAAWTAWEKGAFDAQLLDRAWAHILDTGSGTPTAGRLRRALAFLSMDHFDSGSFSDNVKALAAREVPTKPFGCAVYYSESANKQSEMFSVPNGPFSPQVGNWAIDPYLAVEQVEAVRAVIPVGYYFTDDALASLAQAGGKSPYAPACLIAQNSGYTGTNAGALAYFGMQLSATEKANAAKLGIPIYDDAAATGQTHSAGAVAVAALGPKLPLQLPAGMRGSAFVDQHDRIVILISPTDLSATAATASGPCTSTRSRRRLHGDTEREPGRLGGWGEHRDERVVRVRQLPGEPAALAGRRVRRGQELKGLGGEHEIYRLEGRRYTEVPKSVVLPGFDVVACGALGARRSASAAADQLRRTARRSARRPSCGAPSTMGETLGWAPRRSRFSAPSPPPSSTCGAAAGPDPTPSSGSGGSVQPKRKCPSSGDTFTHSALFGLPKSSCQSDTCMARGARRYWMCGTSVNHMTRGSRGSLDMVSTWSFHSMGNEPTAVVA